MALHENKSEKLRGKYSYNELVKRKPSSSLAVHALGEKNRLALVLSISSCIIVSTSICVSYCYCQVSSGCLETTEGLLCGYTLKFIFKIVIIFSIETTGVDDKSNELTFHLFENVLVQYIDHKWIQSVINPQSAAINGFSLHEGGIIFYSVKDLKKVVT